MKYLENNFCAVFLCLVLSFFVLIEANFLSPALGLNEHTSYGKNFLSYVFSNFSTDQHLTGFTNYLRPAFFGVIFVFFEKIFFFLQEEETIKAVGLVFCFFSFVGLYQTTSFYKDKLAGVFAVLLGFSVPFLFHNFAVDVKEAVFGCFYIWSFCFLIKLNSNFFENKDIDFIWLGVLIGLSLATDIKGFFLLVFVVFLALTKFFCCKEKIKKSEKLKFILFNYLSLIFLTSFLICWLFFPFLWQNSFARFLEVINFELSNKYYPLTFYKMGDAKPYVPDNMFFYNLFFKTPKIIVFCFAVGFLYYFHKIRCFDFKLDEKRKSLFFVILSGFLTSLFLVYTNQVYLRGYLYQIGFVFFPLFILMGAYLSKIIKQSGIKTKTVLSSLLILVYALSLIEIYNYFPFYHLYFNDFIGGAKGAYNYKKHGFTDLDNRQTANYLILKKLDKYLKDKQIIENPKVSICSSFYGANYNNNYENFTINPSWMRSDYKLFYPRGNCGFEGKLENKILDIKVNDQIIAYIYKQL